MRGLILVAVFLSSNMIYASHFDTGSNPSRFVVSADGEEHPTRSIHEVQTKAEWDRIVAREKRQRQPVLVATYGFQGCHWCGVLHNQMVGDNGIVSSNPRATFLHVDIHRADQALRDYYQTWGFTGYPSTVIYRLDRTGRWYVPYGQAISGANEQLIRQAIRDAENSASPAVPEE